MDAIVVTVLTSAGVAAVVSALSQIFGQYLDRRARRKELIFARALDMAQGRYMGGIELVKAGQTGLTILPFPLLAEASYRALEHLFEHGKLDAETKADAEAGVREF